jgi:HAMP domain-containing protein
LHIYREELGRLRNENRRLTDQLARQLGAARAASVTKPT